MVCVVRAQWCCRRAKCTDPPHTGPRRAQAEMGLEAKIAELLAIEAGFGAAVDVALESVWVEERDAEQAAETAEDGVPEGGATLRADTPTSGGGPRTAPSIDDDDDDDVRVVPLARRAQNWRTFISQSGASISPPSDLIYTIARAS